MTRVRAGEMYRFRVGGRELALLVPSTALVELDEPARAILDRLGDATRSAETIATTPAEKSALAELAAVGAVVREGAPVLPAARLASPPVPPPLTTIVLNVTNRCNLACRYCYEYGEDRLAAAEPVAAMTEETARAAVDALFEASGAARRLQVTFFGGETLLNFAVVRPTVAYARRRAAELGKHVEFSLTTNATLLTPSIARWLVDNGIGVTVSIDGPEEVQDRMRVYRSGAGSYAVVAPRIAELLRLPRRRPIGARVTVTAAELDLRSIFRHLTEEMGFDEVGFAPVTSSSSRAYAIDGAGFDRLLDEFRGLAEDYVRAAREGRELGFANLSDLLAEIHQGVAKAYPCGAGLGLLGVAPGGEVGLCHRFAGAGDHDFGDVRTGIDHGKRVEHLERGHIDERTDCRRCWARSLCAGGCYHEAQVRYGDRFRPNLHYCDWIRSWTALGLEVYATLAQESPGFLDRFDGRRAA